MGSPATDNLERTQPTKEAIQHPASRPSLETHDRHQRMFLPGVLAGLSGSQVQDARIPHRGWRWVSSAGYAPERGTLQGVRRGMSGACK